MKTFFKGSAQMVSTPEVRQEKDGSYTMYTMPTSGSCAGTWCKAFNFSLQDLQWMATHAKSAVQEDLRKPKAPAPAPKSVTPDAGLNIDMNALASMVVAMLKNESAPAPVVKKARVAK